MKWNKRGLIFAADGEFGWINSHAQVPTILDLGDRLRVYFSTRPKPGLSLTTFLDVDAQNPKKHIYLHNEPILEPGPPGSFDEHGIMPQSAQIFGDQIWLYYCGWSRRVSIPYSNWIGIAVSEDGGTTFRKMFNGPVLDRTCHEIYSATGACILREDQNWHTWYASGNEWKDVGGHLEEIYYIKYASSRDGINWDRENKKLLPSNRTYEPTHRPTVFKADGEYHMLFCHRGIEDFRDGANSYRLGYATSKDLRSWTRNDTGAGLTVSEEGWDSSMIAYPQVVQSENQTYLFYNGNGFGQTGFGFAILEG